jgi:hypothetical protein
MVHTSVGAGFSLAPTDPTLENRYKKYWNILNEMWMNVLSHIPSLFSFFLIAKFFLK